MPRMPAASPEPTSQTAANAATPLLSVRSLAVEFEVPGGRLRAVDGLDFDLTAGRTLAIVGESGSGKTVTAQAIMRLTDYTGGRIVDGQVLFRSPVSGLQDLRHAGDEALRRIRGNEIAMIFQEPMTSLNPVFTIGNQIAETLSCTRAWTARRPASRPSRCWNGPPARCPAPARRLPAQAVGRHAPARHDRHGPVVQARAADRRRAHHGARRHDPGADPEHHPRAAARPRHGRASSSPTTWAWSRRWPTTWW